MLVVLALAVGLTVWALQRSPGQQSTATSSSEATFSLGELPSNLPESEESSVLLDLVTREPGKTLYQLEYQVSGETISFAYSPGADTLTREQRGADGHGQQTEWQGQATQRLEDSVAGATLADPAEGMSQPTITSF